MFIKWAPLPTLCLKFVSLIGVRTEVWTCHSLKQVINAAFGYWKEKDNNCSLQVSLRLAALRYEALSHFYKEKFFEPLHSQNRTKNWFIQPVEL